MYKLTAFAFICFAVASATAQGEKKTIKPSFKFEYAWLGDLEGGYLAHFKVPVDIEIPSWKMALIFPETIYNITLWQGTFLELTRDKRVVYVKQTEWNGHLWPGMHLDQRFMVRFNRTKGISYNGYAGPKPDILFLNQVFMPDREIDYEHVMKVTDFSQYTKPLPRDFRRFEVATVPPSTTTSTTPPPTTTYDPFTNSGMEGNGVSNDGKWWFRFLSTSPKPTTNPGSTTTVPLIWWQLAQRSTTLAPKPTDVAVHCLKSIEERKKRCKKKKRPVKRCFLPQCAEDGARFKAVQCWKLRRYCWCVDTSTGVKMGKTVVKYKNAAKLNCFVGDQSRTEAVTTQTSTTPATSPSTAYIPEKYLEGKTIPEPVFAPRNTYEYSRIIHNSQLFFEAQRSGNIASNGRVSWRRSAHTNDGSLCGKDLVGGYYNGGDYVKFGYPTAFSMTQLAWGYLESKDAYDAAWQSKFLKDTLKWGADYFMKCHVSQYEFYGQVGDPINEYDTWTRPQDMKALRPCYRLTSRSPGSDLAAETAAALAATAQVFMVSGVDKTDSYVKELLKHAKELFQFADKFRGVYSNSIRAAANYYPSSGYGDELTWAALWIYSATGEGQYLANAQRKYIEFLLFKQETEFSWDRKTAGVQLLLARFTRRKSYLKPLQQFCDYVLPEGGAPYTPHGLMYTSNSGPLRYALNAGFICMVASKLNTIGELKKKKYRKFGEDQIDYVLGKTGKSFVIGFGAKFPTRPHHRASTCSFAGKCSYEDFKNSGPNRQILTGALVGGPDEKDFWVDDRTNSVTNSVSLDYNSALQSSVAVLRQLQIEYKAWYDSQWRSKS